MTRKKRSKKQRILKLLKDSRIELSPKIIAKRLRLNRSTVRNYVRKMLLDGEIIQPYRGAYTAITHGMIRPPPRVHNVILTTPAPWLDFSDDVVERYGAVKLRVQFGYQRHKVTLRLSCDEGMDKNTISFALSRFYDLVKQRTGHVVEDVTIKTFEVNRDYEGFSLDPVKSCFTWKGFFGIIDRIYQKGLTTVRSEQKITRNVKVGEFEALVQKGMRGFSMAQGLHDLTGKVNALADVVKFTNRELSDLKKSNEKVADLLTQVAELLRNKEKPAPAPAPKEPRDREFYVV